MKTQLIWIAVAALGMNASGQTSAGSSEYGSATTQAGQASASAAQAASVSAELTKKIDSKDAKVGDQVAAKTTSDARLADGTKLPKGSKLMGHVTDVQAKSKDNRNSHVAFCFERAVTKDGHEVPLQAMMRSMSAPAAMATATSPDDMMGSGGMQGGGRSSGSPGPVGAGAGTVRGATGPTGGAVGGAANGLADNVTSGAGGTANGALGSAGNVGANGTALNSAGGLNAGLGGVMSVGNLSGVTFANVNAVASTSNGGVSGSAGSSTATMLTGHGRNVTLDSGSQMTMAVAPR